MKIHSNTLTVSDLRGAFAAEQYAGRIADTVQLAVVQRGSRSHAAAFDVVLSATVKTPGDGRITGGGYAPDSHVSATYDEHGWFLSAMFSHDPFAVVGNVAAPIYDSRYGFNHRTGLSYAPVQFTLEYTRGGDDPFPFVTSRNTVGRRGAGRVNGDSLPPWAYRAAMDGAARSWARYEPRDLEWMAEHARTTIAELRNAAGVLA